MDNTNTPGGSSDFQRKLLAIWQDPQVRRLAWKWAGSTDLGDDALQDTVYAILAMEHPERIHNLRAYFLKVLKRMVYRLLAPRRAIPLEDPETALDPDQQGIALCGRTPDRPVDETVCTSVLGQERLERFAAQRHFLRASVPGRSDDPDHYRDVITAQSEQILRDGVNGDASQADSNDTFRAAYPEWFDEPGCLVDTIYQRFRRARGDVQDLLQAMVSRDELT